MTNRDINIDSLTIRLASGWHGDPTYLAKKIADQIQGQADQLTRCKQMSFSLQGPFASQAGKVADKFSQQLASELNSHKPRSRNTGGYHD